MGPKKPSYLLSHPRTRLDTTPNVGVEEGRKQEGAQENPFSAGPNVVLQTSPTAATVADSMQESDAETGGS